MPDLSNLPVPLYHGQDPYHFEYDNIPINSLALRDEIINLEVNNQSLILVEAAGNQGSLSNRLNQSISADGTLLPQAIDLALHNISEHTDDSTTLDSTTLESFINLGFPELANPVGFVRMLLAERTKLQGIANEATNMTISIETPSNIILFDQGPINFVNSESIVWNLAPSISGDNNVSAVLAISTEFAHRHYYNISPLTSNYKNYNVTSSNTVFIEGSLRVYINGTRLTPSTNIYCPNYNATGWNLNGYVENSAGGSFTLSNVITDLDIVQIDFDVLLD